MLPITLDVETSSGRKVLANFTELEQVTLNFVINAQQAIESMGKSKGRILIKLYDTGRRVRLEVHDAGPGVTTEDEPKLFQPFFTTKPVGKGTGLGLSVSYGIIDSYGGSMGYGRNDWGGAMFFFELPGVEIQPNDDRAPVLHRAVSREFDATISAVDRRDDRLVVTLDRTAFYPTSGGQPFDTGTLGALRVTDVFDQKDDTIGHVVDVPTGVAHDRAQSGVTQDFSPAVGATVHGVIDWARRFDHMQQHTGSTRAVSRHRTPASRSNGQLSSGHRDRHDRSRSRAVRARGCRGGGRGQPRRVGGSCDLIRFASAEEAAHHR